MSGFFLTSQKIEKRRQPGYLFIYLIFFLSILVLSHLHKMSEEAYSSLEVLLYDDHPANAPQRDHTRNPPELDRAVQAPQVSRGDKKNGSNLNYPEVFAKFFLERSWPIQVRK